MTVPGQSQPLTIDRLTELVMSLTGAGDAVARHAVVRAVERHGAWGDGLLNVAEALVTLRREPGAGSREPVPAGA